MLAQKPSTPRCQIRIARTPLPINKAGVPQTLLDTWEIPVSPVRPCVEAAVRLCGQVRGDILDALSTALC